MLRLPLLILSLLGAADDPAPKAAPAREPEKASLADQFAALKQGFEAREKAFERALRAANTLDAQARQQKLIDENNAFNRDWHVMDDEVRALVRKHPDDPAALEGIILLPGLMRSFLDDDIVKIVRDHFMNDSPMGRLCAPLAYRTEGWSGALLKDVAAGHPDRALRGQATYALGLYWRHSNQRPDGSPQAHDGRAGAVPRRVQAVLHARRQGVRRRIVSRWQVPARRPGTGRAGPD